MSVGTLLPPAFPGSATSTSPTGRQRWLRLRGPLVVGFVLVLGSAVIAVARGSGAGGELDPRSYEPKGTRALAELLADRGLPVRVVVDLPMLQAAAGPRSTVVVPLPGDLVAEELAQLSRLPAGLLVVAGAGPVELAGLGLAGGAAAGRPVAAEPAATVVREPSCALPAAAAAGAALTGAVAYAAAPALAATGCYPRAPGAAATVLAVPSRHLVLLGAPDLLTNDELAKQGNAALALGLLGAGDPVEADQVLWLLPAPGRVLPAGRRALRDLLPDGVVLGAVQLAVAVLLLAVWRGRRLGRVVVEPLPVVVRAAEAVEGRGRLYRAAGARGTAAEALRVVARGRLARRLGLPGDADRPSLVAAVATTPATRNRSAAEVDRLLYGPAPTDDAALVQLAADLDSLESSAVQAEP